MLENASGGLVNQSTGAYLAGDTVGTTDVVRLSDDGCIGEARFEVRVVNAMGRGPQEGKSSMVSPSDSWLRKDLVNSLILC